MVGTVGSGFIVLAACDSGESVADPFGDCGDDAVAADAVAVGVGDVDEFAFVADAVGGVVVGPAHKALTFEGREASHDGLDWCFVHHDHPPLSWLLSCGLTETVADRVESEA